MATNQMRRSRKKSTCSQSKREALLRANMLFATVWYQTNNMLIINLAATHASFQATHSLRFFIHTFFERRLHDNSIRLTTNKRSRSVRDLYAGLAPDSYTVHIASHLLAAHTASLENCNVLSTELALALTRIPISKP